MSERTHSQPTPWNWRLITALIVAICGATFIGANAHLVYVALKSQPECVPHGQTGATDATFSAAKSAC